MLDSELTFNTRTIGLHSSNIDGVLLDHFQIRTVRAVFPSKYVLLITRSQKEKKMCWSVRTELVPQQDKRDMVWKWKYC